MGITFNFLQFHVLLNEEEVFLIFTYDALAQEFLMALSSHTIAPYNKVNISMRVQVTEVNSISTEELSDSKAKLAGDRALTEHLQSELATLEDRLREYQMISEEPKIYDDIYDDNTPTLVRKKKVSACTSRVLSHLSLS